MTKKKRTLFQYWQKYCAVVAPREWHRRREYCVSPIFDVVLVGLLLIVLGLGLLL